MSPAITSHRARAERIAKANLEGVDEAVAYLRAHGRVETADKLAAVRDFLAGTDGYVEILETKLRMADERSNKARMYLDSTRWRK